MYIHRLMATSILQRPSGEWLEGSRLFCARVALSWRGEKRNEREVLACSCNCEVPPVVL